MTLVVSSLIGEVTSPSLPMNPYEVDADGRPFVPVGAGGVCYNVKIGMDALGWVGDQVEPGVSIANPGERENEALNVYACVGNRVAVRSGAAAGADGVVTGKHEGFLSYKHVLVHLEDDALAQVAPGDELIVRACGRGMGVEGLPQIACHSLGPELWDAWSPDVVEGKLAPRVTRILPPETMGMGSGRLSAATSVALQRVDDALDGLRLGDLVAVRDWQAQHFTGYSKGDVVVGVVACGDSPILGNGPGLTVLLSGPATAVSPTIDENANLAAVLDLPR